MTEHSSSRLPAGRLSWIVAIVLAVVGLVGSAATKHGSNPETSAMWILIPFALGALAGIGLAILAFVRRSRPREVWHAVAGLLVASIMGLLVFNLLSSAAETRRYVEELKAKSAQKK